ncbi:MAG: hypothetical protein WAQ75_11665 [Propionicimonas sp.]
MPVRDDGMARAALGGDPDVDWIVRENHKKARLRRLLLGGRPSR